jgi:hypothetical protein
VFSEYELPLLELDALTQVIGVDARPFAVRQKAMQNGTWKLIWRSDGRVELYDLSSDPTEESALNPSTKAEGKDLEKALEGWIAELRPPFLAAPSKIVRPDEQTRRSLRALGYAR